MAETNQPTQEKTSNNNEEEEDDDKTGNKGNRRARGLKTPKGTRDYDPFQMAIREKVFSIITRCFKRHGAVTIETPIFELKETLTGKYGEDSKLIYDLQDQGGELCSLRYDLTVPFARYVAMNRIKQIKRYQIGRVYRRDNPAMNRGRYREFYQCDFDIAGEYDTMIPDSEALKLLTEILDELNVGNYKIKINHRKLLDGMFAFCGVPEEKFRTICSSVDKLDKTPWEEVKKEMTEVKGLSEEVANKIETFVKLNGSPADVGNYKIKINHRKLLDGMFAFCGVPEEKFRTICSSVDKLDKTPWEEVKKEMTEVKGLSEEVANKIETFVKLNGSPLQLLNQIFSDYSGSLMSNSSAKQALDELKILFEYLECYGVLDKFLFDLSLARGLDYYTGVIYEGIIIDGRNVGSIAGGGRYDNLIGIFGGNIPAVGFSVGVERVFTILEEKAKKDPNMRVTDTDVMVASIDKGLLKDRMTIVGELWKAGIKAEFVHKSNPKLSLQLSEAEQKKIPFAIIFGKSEIESGTVLLKKLAIREQETVTRTNLVNVVKERLAQYYGSTQ
eukprot:TRINITY_DN1462_c0_g1_i1.p1 TRINITY_DN1462_c0_g1~~TRINITY_DN1462_c0_g1_i1.p1  ORF type:complete len:558 (+),score=137.70 TRINITY_DN1462_c0_g1_i1:2-1675(+)